MNTKAAIAIDFDGVIYTGEWTGIANVSGPASKGAVQAINQLASQYRVVIHTCRACHPKGRRAVERALGRWGITYDEVTDKKPVAIAYIDDKGYAFVTWSKVLRQFSHCTGCGKRRASDEVH